MLYINHIFLRSCPYKREDILLMKFHLYLLATRVYLCSDSIDNSLRALADIEDLLLFVLTEQYHRHYPKQGSRHACIDYLVEGNVIM